MYLSSNAQYQPHTGCGDIQADYRAITIPVPASDYPPLVFYSCFEHLISNERFTLFACMIFLYTKVVMYTKKLGIANLLYTAYINLNAILKILGENYHVSSP